MTTPPTTDQRRVLQDRYRALMSMSDEELRVYNANQRIRFQRDRVYQQGQPWIKKEIESRRMSESSYASAFFHRFEDSAFAIIAGFYEDRAAARSILHQHRGRISDLDAFVEEQRYLYERRVETGTRHGLGILENCLDAFSPSRGVYFPLPAPGTRVVERAPRLEEIERIGAV